MDDAENLLRHPQHFRAIARHESPHGVRHQNHFLAALLLLLVTRNHGIDPLLQLIGGYVIAVQPVITTGMHRESIAVAA